MNNLLSYCGLVDARISASEKYLPVKEVAEKERLKIDNFGLWLKEIGDTKDEKCPDENIEFKYDYKVTTCYCKNEDDGTPCNGVATLALTIVLLAISIIGTY